MSAPIVRLTDLAHGGGCGCKLAPSVLQQLLSGQSSAGLYSQLLVGVETGDDARELNDALLRRGVIVRPMGPFGAPGALRITAGTIDEIAFLAEQLPGVIAAPA